MTEFAFTTDLQRRYRICLFMIIVYTLQRTPFKFSFNGSRDKVGCGIFSGRLDLKTFLTLSDYGSTIHAEIIIIKSAAMQIL